MKNQNRLNLSKETKEKSDAIQEQSSQLINKKESKIKKVSSQYRRERQKLLDITKKCRQREFTYLQRYLTCKWEEESRKMK